MTAATRQQTEPTSGWGNRAIVDGLMQRTAATFAAFFLPYLQPGMRLLDCGCGPGSITLGLAAAVTPGDVVGIDLAPQSIAEAQASAAKASITNVRFEVGNVYTLPFPDASFDAVFSHALLLHLREPAKALQEMRRVLRPGGFVGIRNDDHDGYLIAPPDPLLTQGWDLFRQDVLDNGGTVRGAKHQRAWLNAAGFVRVVASASYECYGSPGATAAWSDIFVSLLADAEQRHVEKSLADPVTHERIRRAWQAWGNNPDAFLARSWCEAIGWVA